MNSAKTTKSKNNIFKAGSILVVLLTITILITMNIGSTVQSKPSDDQIYNEPYVGSMHPHIVSEGPGKCEICGMNLSKLEGHTAETPLPSLANIYTSPDNPMYVHEGPGKDPKSGSKLIPITESSIYDAPATHDHAHESAAEEHKLQVDDSGLYTCGMHPDVIQDEPGNCPICGMDLTPLKSSGSRRFGGERVIAYWTAPMDPNYISDKPGKSPMGMDLVPVYENEVTGGVVSIDPVTIQNIGVTTTLVETRDLSTRIRSNGIVTIAEDAEYRINPKFSGWIEKLYVSRTGDMVQAGDALLEIYSPELVSAQEEYLLAMNNADLLSGSGIDRIKSGADKLLSAAKRRLELWDINNSQIEELEKSGKVKRTLTLFSPIRGVVLHKNAIEGAAVKAGMDLFRIVDLNTVWIDAQVYEHELPWLKTGGQVMINSPYDPGLMLNGRIDYIYPYLDAKTRTANIRIVVPNPHLDLRPEMYVDVRIEAQSRKNAVVIPKNAVLRSGVRDIVFIALGEGRFMPREIKLGIETNELYEVTAGLASGTSVVTSAQFLLDSEAKLQEAIQRRLQERMNIKAAS
ncbi:MAG: efflux RND transporter periplasmic adaptor subunit [Calditrichaeota bacterium]|nr:efflux RND transporter periplasmic adaptor subunit [Calditrichota bacterium]